MRLAFFGDVVGKSGRDGLSDHLPGLKRDLKLDFVVVNAENAAGGFGITDNTARELIMAGADCQTLVVGTHTHVPTADCQILPAGTAYQTDAGGCCDYDSVIGNEKEEPLRRFTTRLSGGRYTPAHGPATICGVYVETDDRTGLATRVEPIRVGGRLSQAIPVPA